MATRLRNLRIREVAFCGAGKNENADIALWKAQSEEPRSFDEVAADRKLADAAQIIQDRVAALSTSIWEIVWSDEDDKESRIKESVQQFSQGMSGEVGRILTGELLKFADPDGLPRDGEIGEVIKAALDSAEGDKRMPQDKSVFDDCSEEVRAHAWALAVERNEAQQALASLQEQHKALEAQVGKGKPEGDDLLKSLPEDVRKAWEKDREENKNLRTDVADLKKAQRRRELESEAVRFEKLATPQDVLVSILAKADEHGFLKDVIDALKPLIAQAEQAKSLTELGKTVSGGGSALQALEKEAEDIRKSQPDLSKEQAFTQAMKNRPDLYKQFKEERQ